MKMVNKLTLIAGAVLGLGLVALGTTSASASVNFALGGQIDPSLAPVVVQPLPTMMSGDFVGQTQVGSPGTLANNPGWDPYGTADSTHNWWNIYSGSATFAMSGNSLSMLWGSPNYNDQNNANFFSFYDGDTLVGTVTAADLYADGVDNGNHPGYLVSFTASRMFTSVVAGNIGSANDFEFAFLGSPTVVLTNGVPEASTWAMMGIGFASVGFLAMRRKRQPVAIAI
jgi:hypothetical protein